MMVMTAKVNLKKVLLALAAVAGLIIALVFTLGGSAEADPAAVTAMSDNDSRVQFLKEQGWEVTPSPKESGQVRIPREMSPVYSRYNELQKSQGYDLSAFAGKTVMRYVYRVNNYPGATEPVYATLLVHKNRIIGGDITDTAVQGSVRGLKNTGQSSVTMPSETAPTMPISSENNSISE